MEGKQKIKMCGEGSALIIKHVGRGRRKNMQGGEKEYARGGDMKETVLEKI